MSQLNSLNIKNHFRQLTGISEQEFSQQTIVDNAAKYIEKQLKYRELTEPQKERCEYAAAVCAVYEYVLARDLSERIVVTQDGRAVQDFRDQGAVSAAFELKKAALDSISDLTNDGFAFKSTGGV